MSGAYPWIDERGCTVLNLGERAECGAQTTGIGAKQSLHGSVRPLPQRCGLDKQSVTRRSSNVRWRLRLSAGSTDTFTRPRRSSGFRLAVSVVRSMASKAETLAMVAGSGRLSEISSENCPFVSSVGRSASSKRRASVRAARCVCRHRQVSRTRWVNSNGSLWRFDMAFLLWSWRTGRGHACYSPAATRLSSPWNSRSSMAPSILRFSFTSLIQFWMRGCAFAWTSSMNT